jgi:hypothetical protein
MSNEELIAEARERAAKYTGGPEADRLWRLADALEAAQPTDYSKVTRVVVVPSSGAVCDQRNVVDGGVDLHLQDEGRTLKVFPTPPDTETENT